MAKWVIQVENDDNEIEEFERYLVDDAEKIRAQFVEEFGPDRVKVFVEGEKIDSKIELVKPPTNKDEAFWAQGEKSE